MVKKWRLSNTWKKERVLKINWKIKKVHEGGGEAGNTKVVLMCNLFTYTCMYLCFRFVVMDIFAIFEFLSVTREKKLWGLSEHD